MNPEDYRAERSRLDSAPTTSGLGERVARDVKETVSSSVEYRKRQAADVVHGLADAVRHVGSEQARGTRFKTYADGAATQLERLAEGIRTKGPADLARDLRTVARRQPVLFIGGAFVAGLALARFLKSSDAEEDDGSRGAAYRRRDETDRGRSWTA
jgi:hypothetical protein